MSNTSFIHSFIKSNNSRKKDTCVNICTNIKNVNILKFEPPFILKNKEINDLVFSKDLSYLGGYQLDSAFLYYFSDMIKKPWKTKNSSHAGGKFDRFKTKFKTIGKEQWWNKKILLHQIKWRRWSIHKKSRAAAKYFCMTLK